MMPLSLMLLSACVLATTGTFLIIKPEKRAAYYRKRYQASSKFLQNWPGSNMVMKSWYPLYLRIHGVVCWMFALVLIYAVVIRMLK
jgi:hypothetical protein